MCLDLKEAHDVLHCTTLKCCSIPVFNISQFANKLAGECNVFSFFLKWALTLNTTTAISKMQTRQTRHHIYGV